MKQGEKRRSILAICAVLAAFMVFVYLAHQYVCFMPTHQLIVIFFPLFFVDLPRYMMPDLLILFKTIAERARKQSIRASSYTPVVSVIVPAYNEERAIVPTLQAVANTDYDRKEIILIDDGSTDNTYERAKQFSLGEGIPIRLFRKAERGGKAAALNLGLTMSKGDIIVSMDADTLPFRDSIRKMVRYFEDDHVIAVAASIRVKNRDENLITRLQSCEYMTTFGVGRYWLSLVQMLFVVSGAFGAFRRSLLESVGSWDPGIGDDSNVTIKMRKTGDRVVLAKEAMALTEVPGTVRGFYRQRLRWEKNFIRNRFKKHGDILRGARFGLSNPLAILSEFSLRVVLLYGFLYYVFYLILFMPDVLPFAIMFSFMFYGVLNLLSLAIASYVSGLEGEWKNIAYFPLIFFYRMFLRFPRLVGYTEEFLGVRYEHPYYPSVVWARTERWILSKRMFIFLALYSVLIWMVLHWIYNVARSLI
jgi:cellulose synthase/poly-beta-1,6-N-acetylglucosamine synthase-like glycosyltransferase